MQQLTTNRPQAMAAVIFKGSSYFPPPCACDCWTEAHATGGTRKQQQEDFREQDRAHRIDVLQRIKTDPTKRHAVSSPRRCATKPCAASCTFFCDCPTD